MIPYSANASASVSNVIALKLQTEVWRPIFVDISKNVLNINIGAFFLIQYVVLLHFDKEHKENMSV